LSAVLIAADTINGYSISSNSAIYSGALYNDTFYYKSGTQNVVFNCEDAYKFAFVGAGGIGVQGGLSAANIYSAAVLSAGTFVYGAEIVGHSYVQSDAYVKATTYVETPVLYSRNAELDIYNDNATKGINI